MLGGSLTRYHTPTLEGRGFIRDLTRITGPTLVQSLDHGLKSYGTGASASEALKSSEAMLKRGLKRKLPQLALAAGKNKVKLSYKKKRQRVKDILGV